MSINNINYFSLIVSLNTFIYLFSLYSKILYVTLNSVTSLVTSSAFPSPLKSAKNSTEYRGKS